MKKNFKPSTMLNPVPAVLVTTRNKEGQDNVFTVAWTGTICTRPPMLYISVRKERLSHKYLTENPVFVVNLPSLDLVKATDYCGVRSGVKYNKIKDMNLTIADSENINCGYIENCPINIECSVTEVKELGSHDMFLAKIENILVDEVLIETDGKINFTKAKLFAYSHGEYFPLNKYAVGKFGYSVAKKNKKKVK